MTCDCETDPFLKDRVPKPFLWGLYDGKKYYRFDTTDAFVAAVIDKHWLLYAHNGGKFDFMFLLPYVGETRAQIISSRIIAIGLGKAELRDSYAIVPVPLGSIQKDKIEMWKLEAGVRDQHMDEIVAYNNGDCAYLWNIVDTYRKMAGHQRTIASNALQFAKKKGVDVGKTNHRFDAMMRRFFFGGRTECFKPGVHRNIVLLDIHSAYPFAMTHDHVTGHNFRMRSTLDGLTDQQVQRAFITLTCQARGCFPLRTKQGLIFPHEYNQFWVTGWEYIAARDLGLIANVSIDNVLYTDDVINFGPYVGHWYDLKNATDKRTHPIEYTIAKIMLNSLYGKTAQNPERYYDYKYVKGGTKICREPIVDKNDTALCALCGKKMIDHGWELAPEFDQMEIHYRPSLWRWKYLYGEEWTAKKLYKNVATGASITGFTRAHLLRAMHAVGERNVIYCDTDGLAALPGANVAALSTTKALGDWEIEDAGAPIGYFGGKKLYAIKLSNGKEKLATKGARLGFEDIRSIVEDGKIVDWANAAPTFHIDGSADFIVRSIRATAKAVVR